MLHLRCLIGFLISLCAYCVNHTTPFEVCCFDYMGPTNVKNLSGNLSYEMFYAYILIFTCATSRAVIVDPAKNGSSKMYKLYQKVNLRRKCPKKIVSDNGTVLKSQENQLFVRRMGRLRN